MSSIVPPVESCAHLRRLDDLRPSQAKATLNNVATDWKAAIGVAIARAIAAAGLSQKEAAVLVGRDAGQFAKWLSGVERPQFDALFSVESLRGPLVIQLAGLSPDIAVETTITIRRTA